MGYAVLHSEKGSTSSGGIGNHIDRVKGMEHSFQHSNPELIHLNQNYKVPNDRQRMKLSDAINDRLKEGYNGKRKIRTDAVKYITHILTGSHEDMKVIFQNKTKAEEWVKENYKFIAKEFGQENMVRFTLHLDEKTPHIHAVTVPLTPDGRLSAKEVFGNKVEMQKRQDRYAESMKVFGLERGIRSTGIKHENAREYYARIKESQEKGQKIGDFTAKTKVMSVEVGIDKTKTIENLQNALKTFKTAQISAEKERDQLKKNLESVKETAQLNKSNFELVINNKEKFEQIRENRIKKAESDILYSVKQGVEYEFRLHESTPEERNKFALKLANDRFIKLNLKGDLSRKLINNEDLIKRIIDVVEERAFKSFEHSKSHKNSRGRSL